MRRLMDGFFSRYGTEAVITSEESAKKAKVFFHSINSRSWQNMERMFFPLGEIQRGQYICVLPIDTPAKAGDTLTVMGRSYKLRRVEEMFVKGTALYRWGLCVEKGGDHHWGARG